MSFDITELGGGLGVVDFHVSGPGRAWRFRGGDSQVTFEGLVNHQGKVTQTSDFLLQETSLTAFQIQNVGGTQIFNVDTSGPLVTIVAPVTISGGNLAMAGDISKYFNVTTAGWGVPAIYASGRATAQAGAVASLATYTVGAADGSFEVHANVLVTTATTHAFTVTCAYTDEGNTARTLTLPFVLVAGSAIVTSVANANGAVPYQGIPLRIRAKAGTTITVATTGTFTTVAYNVEADIKQVS